MWRLTTADRRYIQTFVIMQVFVISVCQLCLYLTYFVYSGHYSPERSGRSVFRSSPAYSLSARSQEVSTNQTPGNTLCWLYLICGIVFHGTKNIHLTCCLCCRSSLLLPAPCLGAQNRGNICCSYLFAMWPQQNWQLS